MLQFVRDWKYVAKHTVAHFWITAKKPLCQRASSDGFPLLDAGGIRRCNTCVSKMRPHHISGDHYPRHKRAMAAKYGKLKTILESSPPFRRADAYWQHVTVLYNSTYHAEHTVAAISELARRYKHTAKLATTTVYAQLEYGFVCECGDSLPYNAITSGATIECWLKAHAEHRRRYHKDS